MRHQRHLQSIATGSTTTARKTVRAQGRLDPGLSRARGWSYVGSGRAQRDEQGAVLILAMIFVLVTSLAVSALLSLGGGSLLDTAQFRTLRATDYAADGATDAAVQAVRYSSDAYNVGGPSSCLPDALSSIPISGVAISVDCIGTLSKSDQTRVVDFFACLSTGCSASNAILQAQVTFDDYSTTDSYTCNTSATTTCGTGMEINSWVINAANS